MTSRQLRIDSISVLPEQLDQYGYDIAESDSLTDPELLMEVMEAREELEEASTEAVNVLVEEGCRGTIPAARKTLVCFVPLADTGRVIAVRYGQAFGQVKRTR